MAIGKICNRIVVVVTDSDSVTTAAELMREHPIGSLVVIKNEAGRKIPVGIFTDRDIAVGVVALGLDPSATKVGDVISGDVTCVRENAGVAEVAALIQQKVFAGYRS